MKKKLKSITAYYEVDGEEKKFELWPDFNKKAFDVCFSKDLDDFWMEASYKDGTSEEIYRGTNPSMIKKEFFKFFRKQVIGLWF